MSSERHIIFVHTCLAYFNGIIAILLLIYWLIIITYRLFLIRSKRKQYNNASELDPRTHSQIIYSFQTVRNRDICLVIILLLEIADVVIISFAIPEPFIYSIHSNKKINETFTNCSIAYRLFANLYVHPVYALLVVTLPFLSITQLMLLSLLNSYLSGRYFGHRFPKLVVYKYIFIWTFQSFLLGMCIIPKLQILLFPTITLLVFLNWLNLVISSRKMCRAIQSKMKEIRLFEWDANMFRNYSRNFRQYRIGMGFLIGAFFFAILALSAYTISYSLFIGSCFIHSVYGIRFYLKLYDASEYTMLLNIWVVFPCLCFYEALLFLPSLSIFLYHVANLLYDKCTGKGNMQRINNALFEPLMLRYT